MSECSVVEIPGRRHKRVSAQSLNYSFFVFNMAENGLFWGVLSSDKKKAKRGILFIFSQNVLDRHKFSKLIKTVSLKLGTTSRGPPAKTSALRKNGHHSGLVLYLSDRTQIVCVDGTCSDPQPVQSGVPQGSILGPLLFILYINDLPSCLQFSEVLMYADDTVIYFSGNSIPDIEMKLSLDLTNESDLS